MIFTIDQNLIMTAILISVAIDIFLKPILKPLKPIFKSIISRTLLFTISVAVMYYLRRDTFMEDGITTSVIAMLFYDVAGYSLLSKKLKERLSGESKIITK